ncbi:hypothetical protein N781_14985 [Pontibacillus halophilus JSM 076056 = DSM 19796]|uniref:Metallo-beta-lactamase domain-containing protein n=1 Tax=Pontibacillus halophilus JSM 076056 = DSM 19796 TaxID=1385510 RepID=A0A0A5GN19_9BACI|nr:MBL fold metallo-hydrolase [Pontibacillus halophilus]KGX92628.1 hypothetical protein N781_14985 [Pontibacillus halophilus JSM 076056 = DSM 19796]
MKFTVNGFWGGYPGAGEATSSYLVEKDGFTLMIDCGSGALSRLQERKSIMDLDAVLITHYHFDHVADIGPLQYAHKVQNAIGGTEKVLPIYGHQEDEAGFDSLTHDYTEGISYDPSSELRVGPFTVTFMKTNHPVPCYATRITDGESVIVFTADSSYKDSFIPFSEGADLLVTDCNFYKGMDGSKPGHMTSEEVGHIANQAQVGELWISHLPHFGEVSQLKTEASEQFSGEVKVAYEGLQWMSRSK